ncbi:MAG: SH3 domain-containing protein [Clostridia bacterium]|nr:SH3 domain-containing protein [Clostridia bacterium]
MKRLVAMILTLALTMMLLATPTALANDYSTATVKGGWLRLRAEASYDAETISAYYTGTSVTILGGSGNWYYVLAPDGNKGYMSASYLTITGSITGGQLSENTAAYVTSKNGLSVRLRTGPSLQYSTIASYAVGTSVTIMTMGDTWCRVRIGGRTGYMMTEFLTTTKPDVSEPNYGTAYTAYVVSDNGLPVRLRTEMSTDSNIISTYNVGTQVTVQEYGSIWCRISINGVTGYMMTRYLSTTKPSTSTTSYTAYVTSSNGKSVRLRSGAGKGYTTLATYSVGTQVTIVEYGRTWCKVTVNNRTGYMMTEFLTTEVPSIVSSVSISATSVWPGQTLYATVSPSDASVTYEWINDKGYWVGSGSSYTVQTTDAGRKIRVRVTGKDGSSGTATSSWATVQGNGNVSVGYMLTGVSISDSTPEVGQTLTASIMPANATANIVWYRGDGTVVGSGSSYTVRANDVGSRLYVYAEGTNVTTGSVTSAFTGAVANASGAAGNTGSSGSTGTGSAVGARIMGVTLSDTTPTVGQTIYATVNPSGADAYITWYRDDDKVLAVGSYYTVQPDDAGHTMYVWAEGMGSTTGGATSSITSPVQSVVTVITPGTTTDLNW